MKQFLPRVLALASLLNLAFPYSAPASLFDNTEVRQEKFIAIASPFGVEQRRYTLLLVEQISNARPCWRESAGSPTRVDPLLLDFDFTGTCERGIDGNYYSIRIGNEDYGGRYLLSIVPRDNDLVLMGTSLTEPNLPPIEIGRTNGIADGYLKINLNPGWRFTKRTYQGKVLSHIYFTGDPTAIAQQPPSAPLPRPPVSTPSSPPRLPLPPPASSTAPLPGVTLPPPLREVIFTKP
ncbi:DUF3747 domain-containing protein [Oscillatoria sp. FACHB-1406]|uniref:DUF3747 domain-containing protein n=1 Tax=Oscillatoria sp. FACHB-1406 TaxID=2692846 RepID=UPI00168851FB|nr:DUF3747 domain-containing protein [Oscillatoria sp. FACHB-1406]MBD2577936.1 DUF3747 domain-containing protein [Oscillatoria sp. FACHB-1406]